MSTAILQVTIHENALDADSGVLRDAAIMPIICETRQCRNYSLMPESLGKCEIFQKSLSTGWMTTVQIDKESCRWQSTD